MSLVLQYRASKKVNACANTKCAVLKAVHEKDSEKILKDLVKRYTAIAKSDLSQEKKDAKKAVIREELSQRKPILEYRRCLDTLCEKPVMNLAKATVKLIEAAKVSTNIHKALLDEIQTHIKNKTVTSKIISGVLARLPVG